MLLFSSRRIFLPMQSGCLASSENIWTNAREWFWKHPIKNFSQYLECEAILDFQKILFKCTLFFIISIGVSQNTCWLISLSGQNPLCRKMLRLLFTAIIIILTDLFLITWLKARYLTSAVELRPCNVWQSWRCDLSFRLYFWKLAKSSCFGTV